MVPFFKWNFHMNFLYFDAGKYHDKLLLAKNTKLTSKIIL